MHSKAPITFRYRKRASVGIMDLDELYMDLSWIIMIFYDVWFIVF